MNPLALLAGGALALSVGIGIGWTTNGWRLNAEIADIKSEYSKAAMKSESAARAKEQALQTKLQEAQNAAKEREKKLLADAVAARAESGRLRDDIATFRRQLPGLTEAAVRKYADTASIVLSECQSRYSELAEAVDRIDNDRQTLVEAWPK